MEKMRASQDLLLQGTFGAALLGGREAVFAGTQITWWSPRCQEGTDFWVLPGGDRTQKTLTRSVSVQNRLRYRKT